MGKRKVWLVLLCVATLVMLVATAYVYAYNSSQASRFSVFFGLEETEPTENYIELHDPLDWFTQNAIETGKEAFTYVPYENLSDWILYPYWLAGLKDGRWEDPGFTFKYQDRYYKFLTEPEIFWTPSLGIKLPLEPLYGGWIVVGVGWLGAGYRSIKRAIIK